MRYYFYIVLILCLTSSNGYSNIGGAFYKQSVIGGPGLFELTDISISNANMHLIFTEDDEGYICKFTSQYSLSAPQHKKYNLIGMFYGIRSTIKEISSNMESLESYDHHYNYSRLDSLFYFSPVSMLFNQWYETLPVNRYGFEYEYDPEITNVIRVEGELRPEKTRYWGAMVDSPIASKHPLFNSSVNPKEQLFQYLIEPISSWKSVDSLCLRIEYPDGTILSMNTAERKVEWVKTDSTVFTHEKIKSGSYGEQQEYMTCFTDSWPEVLEIKTHKKTKLFCVGGPYFSFANVKGHGKMFNYSWEAGLNFDCHSSLMFRLGYETDNEGLELIVPIIQFDSQLLASYGLNIGFPYNRRSQKYANRVGISLYLGIFGVEWVYDSELDDFFKFSITL